MKKVAVIGFGFIGKIHALNILKNKDLQLVALVDRNIETIEKELNSKAGNFSAGEITADDIKEVRKYTDLDVCLKNEELDAVHICVHTDLHYEFTKKALEHGLNVMVEKPFVLDVEKGEELIRLAGEKGLMLMVAHVVRFMPPYLKLKEWVDNGTYGKLRFLSLIRFSGVPQWGQWKEKQNDFGSSGGALFDLVIHDIDLAYYLLGENPDKIVSNVLPGKLSRHDYINAVWSYSGQDVTVKIEGGNIFHAGFPFSAGFTARFENATVFYSTSEPEVILVSDDDKNEKVSAGDLAKGYFNEIEYFYYCIAEKHEPLMCMPGSSLDTIRLCYEHI